MHGHISVKAFNINKGNFYCGVQSLGLNFLTRTHGRTDGRTHVSVACIDFKSYLSLIYSGLQHLNSISRMTECEVI